MTTNFKAFIFVLFLSGGCAPMAEIEIQVMDPAVVTVPMHIGEIAYLNRSVFPEFLYPDTSTWTSEELAVLDTIVKNWMFRGVSDAMNESPLYNLGGIQVIQARRIDSTGIMDPLNKIEIAQFKNRYQADAIISLEFYFIKDTIDVFLSHDEISWDAYMGFHSTTVWRIYDLTRDTIVDKHIVREYSDWLATGATVESALSKLPNAIDAIRHAAYMAGAGYGDRISPTWKGSHRFFYGTGGNSMKEAGRMVSSGEWDQATDIWKKIAFERNKKIAARASYNMAIFWEMEDDIVVALDWAVRSYSIRQDELTKEYIELLKHRYNERRKLRKQLPEEFFPVLQI